MNQKKENRMKKTNEPLKDMELPTGTSAESIINKADDQIKKNIDAKDKTVKALIDAGEDFADKNPDPHAYRGARSSFFVFHPKNYQRKDPTSQAVYLDVLNLLLKQLNAWYETCELYQDEMQLSEGVTFKNLKADIKLLLESIKKDNDVYQLEALAEVLWDKDTEEKTQKHFIPSHEDIRNRGLEIRAEDSNIEVPQAFKISKVIKRTYGG